MGYGYYYNKRLKFNKKMNIFDIISDISIGNVLSNNWLQYESILSDEEKVEALKSLMKSFEDSVDFKPILCRDFSFLRMNEFIKDCYANILNNLNRIYNIQPIVTKSITLTLGKDFIPKKDIILLFDSDLSMDQSKEWKDANKDWLAVEDHIWRYEILHIKDVQYIDNNTVNVISNYHRFAWRYSYNDVNEEMVKVLLDLDLKNAGVNLSQIESAIT